MIYELKGRIPESGKLVKVELGFSERSGFFFGVDDGDTELRSGTELLSVPLLMERTGDLGIWDRRTLNAMLRAPIDDYTLRHAGSPVAKLITRIR